MASIGTHFNMEKLNVSVKLLLVFISIAITETQYLQSIITRESYREQKCYTYTVRKSLGKIRLILCQYL